MRQRTPDGMPINVAARSTVASNIRRSDVTRTVAGHLGVVSIATLGSRVASALRGDDGRVDLADTVASRIMSFRSASAFDDPFGPLAFRTPDDQFVMILRDVVDRGTIEWVTSRLCKAIERPVEMGDIAVDPAPVFGVAFGDVRHWVGLVEAADMALDDARLSGPGTVVMQKVGTSQVDFIDRVDLIDVQSGRAAGKEIVASPLGSLRQHSELGIDGIENMALSTTVSAGQELLVSVGPEVLCRRDAESRLLTLANELDLKSVALVLVVPPRIGSAGFGAARKTADRVRRIHTKVLLDLSSAGPTPRVDFDLNFDGLIVDAGAAVMARGPRPACRNHLLNSVDPAIRLIARGAGPAHVAFMEPLGIREALSASLAWQGVRTSKARCQALQRSDRTIGGVHPAQLAQVRSTSHR